MTELLLSAVVVAQDEEARLGPCLASLVFADEIVVVDGGSRDGTVALAERLGARVVHHPFRGWGSSRERGRAEARGQWVLAIDADERVPAELAEEVRARLADAKDDVDAFSLPIKTYYRDRWLRHGGFWPSRRVRLYRRARGSYAADREVHERVAVPGRVELLAQPLEHRSFGSFGEALRRVERYSTVAASALAARGERAGVLRIAGHATARFFRGYVLRGGFLDGVPGLWFAALGGYEALAKYAKLWEAGATAGAGAREGVAGGRGDASGAPAGGGAEAGGGGGRSESPPDGAPAGGGAEAGGGGGRSGSTPDAAPAGAEEGAAGGRIEATEPRAARRPSGSPA